MKINFQIIIMITGCFYLSLSGPLLADEPGLADEPDDGAVEYTEVDLDAILFADKSGFSISLGLDYTKGDYGEIQKTSLAYVPVSLQYATGPWNFQVSSGYFSVRGNNSIIPGTGFVIITDGGNDVAAPGNDNSIADLFVSSSYAIESLHPDGIYIDLTARVKIPLAPEENGLGTGKTDVSLQIDMAKIIGDFMPFVTLGYRFVGKTENFALQNSWSGSLGLIYYMTYDVSLGLSYDVRRSATVGRANPREIQAFVNYQATRNWGIYLYGIAGLSDGSPDGGAGFQLTYSY